MDGKSEPVDGLAVAHIHRHQGRTRPRLAADDVIQLFEAAAGARQRNDMGARASKPQGSRKAKPA